LNGEDTIGTALGPASPTPTARFCTAAAISIETISAHAIFKDAEMFIAK
jgi:hypothetical protein